VWARRYDRPVTANPSVEVLDQGPSDATGRGEPGTTLIEARRSTFSVSDIRELWSFRELAFALAWRDLSVRYKQTFIGIAWAVIQPFLTMVIFTIVFGKFAQLPSDDIAYPVFLFSGLLPWTYFASSLQAASNSVTANRALVQKVYFPRLLLPLGSPIVPAVDFLVASIVLLGMMVYYDVAFAWTILLAPLFIMLAACVAVAFGLVLATLNVRYRDVPYVVPVIIQLWLYVSPVIYATNGLPEKWEKIISLNPMNLVISGFRWAVVDGTAPTTWQIGIALAVTAGTMVVGLVVFQRGQARFADTL
jgi:lipopolysaccharide transport system permease protein